MRILYICQYFTTPDEPGSGRAYGFARRWAERGHEVTVLTGAVNYKLAALYPECRGRLATRQRLDGFTLIRLWAFAGFRGSVRRRILFFLSFAGVATAVGIFQRRPDAVFASSTPLTVGLPGLALSVWWRRPLVFEVRDLWPEAALAAGVMRPGPLASAAERFARLLYRRARAVVALTRGIRERIVDAGMPQAKVHFIPNGAEPWMLEDGHSGPANGDGVRADEAFRCVYSGGLGRWNGVHTIVDAAAALADEPGIRFEIIGEGDERARLEARLRERGARNVEFTGALPKREAMRRLCAGDVCLLPGLDREFYRLTFPNKLFDYLASGRPIVVSSPGEATDVVQEARAGLVVAPEDASAMAEAIRRLRAMPREERRAMGLRGLQLARTAYRRVDLADRALAVIENAASGGSHAAA